MSEQKKIYFASDFHLGTPNYKTSREREDKVIRWLNQIKPTCKELYLVGDVFDFWFEYKHVIPKHFVRFLGKIAEFTDSGIPVYFFTGNHDMWMFDYLEKEIGITIIRDQPITKQFGNLKVQIGHGDGLGPGDFKYKALKKLFASKFCQWWLARIHPNFTMWLATGWSKSSRASCGEADLTFEGADKEMLIQYSEAILKKEHYDYFIFGHRHLPMEHKLTKESTYINLGEWLSSYSYAEFDGKKIALKKFES